MKKHIFSLALLSFCGLVNAQFPYANSLQTTGSYTSIAGASTVPKSNTTVNGTPTKGVLLTEAKTSQFAGIELNGVNFPTTRGFNIDFEYFQWGGSGRGDGLALVLFDAATSPTQLGVKGAGLGYTYTKDPINTPLPEPYTPGFMNGYMAFGIDTYGNFHKRREEGDDQRNGVVTFNTSTGKYQHAFITFPSFSGTYSSYFTIRGGMDNPKWMTGTDPARRLGYPVLYTVNTSVSSSGTSSTNANALSFLALNDGTHGYRNISGFAGFDIRSGAYTEDVKNNAYRKAYIQFKKGKRRYYDADPDKNPSAVMNEELTSYFASVFIETNSGRQKIADHEQFRIAALNDQSLVERKYIEPTSGPGWDRGSSPKYLDTNQWDKEYNLVNTYKAIAPSNLKMAFTASTGDAYQNQLVRNVNISLPFAPDVVNDVFTLCPNITKNLGTPLANDLGYNDDTYIQRVVGTPQSASIDLVFLDPIIAVGNANYLDPESFAFMVLDPTSGKFVMSNPTGTSSESHHVYDSPDLGTFHYVYKDENGAVLPANQAYIMFKPKAGIPLGTYSIYYTVKNQPITTQNGNPLGGEEYRSAVSVINVNMSSITPCARPYIITNKNVTTNSK